MATLTANPGAMTRTPSKSAHRARVTLAALAAASVIVFLSVHGYSYYSASIEDRPFSPLHGELRSSGAIGLKLGILGVCLFCEIGRAHV